MKDDTSTLNSNQLKKSKPNSFSIEGGEIYSTNGPQKWESPTSRGATYPWTANPSVNGGSNQGLVNGKCNEEYKKLK